MSAVLGKPRRGARAGFALTGGSVIVTAVALIGAGGAFAYFTQGGSSAASASVGHGLAVHTTVTVPVGTVLYPGGPKGGFTITVQPSAAPVRITDIEPDASRSVLVTGAPGCPGTVVTLTAQHNLTLDVDATAVTRNYPNAVSLDASAPNACQGATFEIPVLLTGRSR
jgi:hypothetical protein